jgi:hypothetical protein
MTGPVQHSSTIDSKFGCSLFDPEPCGKNSFGGMAEIAASNNFAIIIGDVYVNVTCLFFCRYWNLIVILSFELAMEQAKQQCICMEGMHQFPVSGRSL